MVQTANIDYIIIRITIEIANGNRRDISSTSICENATPATGEGRSTGILIGLYFSRCGIINSNNDVLVAASLQIANSN